MSRTRPLGRLLLCATVLFQLSCGDDATSDDTVDATADAPDETQNSGTLTPSYAADDSGFYAFPWPSDHRVTDDGSLDLGDFPESNNPFVDLYLGVLTEFVHGFATVPVIYVRFDTPLPEAIPEPSETLAADSSIQLINLSEGCDQRIPVESVFEEEGDAFVDEGVLSIAPVPGFVLEPVTSYALVVTTTFGSEAGYVTATPSLFAEALAGSSSDQALNDSLAPLRDCLDGAGLTSEEIAVATVFTTQDPTEELIAMRAVAVDPDATQAPTVSNWAIDDDASISGQTATYTGTFESPIFQRGQSPYNSGGGVEYDSDGLPRIQRYEEVPFIITFPENREPPFPVFIWEDGTGATLDSFVTSPITRLLLREGIAIASFEAQFHGQRASTGADPTTHTFNYLNPESGRTVLRQQVVDTAYFVRLLREGLDGLEGLPELNTDRLIYGGQSQGALVGAIAAGVETEIAAYALNGIGGYLSITIVDRKDPIDINAQIQGILGLSRPLTRFHPLVALAQMGGEVSDTLSYASRWRGWQEHTEGSNLLLINGMLDVTTPTRSLNAITIAGSVTPIDPAGWDVDPFGVWDMEAQSLPLSGNTSAVDGSSLTIATILDGSQGHYTIYNIEEARLRAVNFWSTAVDGIPTISD